MGLLSLGSSSSKTNQQTYNNDHRVVADGGSIGLSGNGSTFEVTDGGIVARALDTVDRNLKLVNDSAGDGYASLLGLTERLFKDNSERATAMAGTVEKNVIEAYRNASADASSTIDNRTIVVLGLAAAAVVGFIYMKRK